MLAALFEGTLGVGSLCPLSARLDCERKADGRSGISPFGGMAMLRVRLGDTKVERGMAMESTRTMYASESPMPCTAEICQVVWIVWPRAIDDCIVQKKGGRDRLRSAGQMQERQPQFVA